LFLVNNAIEVLDGLLQCSFEPGFALRIRFPGVLAHFAIAGPVTLVHTADASRQAGATAALGATGATCPSGPASTPRTAGTSRPTGHLAAETANTAASATTTAGATG
jgi:hypothetical protein